MRGVNKQVRNTLALAVVAVMLAACGKAGDAASTATPASGMQAMVDQAAQEPDHVRPRGVLGQRDEGHAVVPGGGADLGPRAHCSRTAVSWASQASSVGLVSDFFIRLPCS